MKNLTLNLERCIGRWSELTLHNKQFLCKQILWIYDIQVWDCAKKIITSRLPKDSKTVFSRIHPWYIRNYDIHRFLKETVDGIMRFAVKQDKCMTTLK